MKYFIIISSLLLADSVNIFAQKEIQYLLYDSANIGYDTVITKEPPVCINYSEVQGKLEWPYRADAEGYVYATCMIDTLGNVEALTDIKGVEVFFNEVKRVIYMLKFSPGKINNQPVKYYGVVPFKFILK
ncbi:MAG: energy transducer TonB [Ignavibacteria bacterium]|nr:energy transducer TonB [Ignavibacteria bacterium]